MDALPPLSSSSSDSSITSLMLQHQSATSSSSSSSSSSSFAATAPRDNSPSRLARVRTCDQNCSSTFSSSEEEDSFFNVPPNSTPASQPHNHSHLAHGHHDNRGATPTSVGSSGVFCRICHDGEEREGLVAPCRCAGTMGLMHRSCVEKWLSTANTTCCEICSFEFCVSRQPRPFSHWLRHPGRPSDRRNLVGDCVCFMLLTPLAAVSVWLCMTGALHYIGFGQGATWETTGLITLSAFLIVIYIIWCLVAVRYHLRVFKDWRKANCIIRVQPPPKSTDKIYMDLLRLDVNDNIVHELHRHDDHGPASISLHSTLALRDGPRRTVAFPRRLSSIPRGSVCEGMAGVHYGAGYDLVLSRISDESTPAEGEEEDTDVMDTSQTSEACFIWETAV